MSQTTKRGRAGPGDRSEERADVEAVLSVLDPVDLAALEATAAAYGERVEVTAARLISRQLQRVADEALFDPVARRPQ